MRSFTVAALLFAASIPAFAQSIQITTRTEKTGGRETATLLIGGSPALRLKSVYNGEKPAERARTTATRLRSWASKESPASRIRATKEEGVWTVAAGDVTLVSINRREARAHESDADALARRWAAQIRRLISAPALKLSASSVTVPFTKSREISISGWAAGSLKLGALPRSGPVKAELKGKRLLLSGIALGRARVKVIAGSRSAECAVEVRKYAGDLNSAIKAEVTGRPAPAALQADAAALAIRRFVPREPGAQLKVLSLQQPSRPLAAGKKSILRARVRISGAAYLPVEGELRVEVSNLLLPPRRTSQLMYSNVPEKVTTDQTLYFAEIPSKVSGRLFYHHINSAKKPALLTVTLVNPEEKPVKLQLIAGFIFAHPDPVRAGHRAGRAFFSRFLRNVGEVYTLPARSSVPLVVDLLKPEDVGSGMAEIRAIEPESARCYIRITASYKVDGHGLKSVASYRDAWRRVLPRTASAVETAEAADSPDLYPTTAKQISAEYTVGDKWTWIPVGKVPVTAAAGGRRLEGNYGVIYRIDVKVHNPGEKRRQVEVAFEAGAGQASGVFAIADQYVEVPSIFPREEKPLARFTMGPNETRSISIQTVPLGGSAYPASLIVR